MHACSAFRCKSYKRTNRSVFYVFLFARTSRIQRDTLICTCIQIPTRTAPAFSNVLTATCCPSTSVWIFARVCACVWECEYAFVYKVSNVKLSPRAGRYSCFITLQSRSEPSQMTLHDSSLFTIWPVRPWIGIYRLPSTVYRLPSTICNWQVRALWFARLSTFCAAITIVYRKHGIYVFKGHIVWSYGYICRCVCAYVCMYVYMYVCMCADIYIYISVYVCDALTCA